jgi:protein-tyrosine-phosphatase
MEPFDASAILFACDQNTVRSPMAAALLTHLRPDLDARSVGLKLGAPDHLMVAVMAELGLDLSAHRAHLFADLKPARFALIVTLSPEAQHRALEWTRAAHTPVEYWPTFDATAVEGSREQQLAAYRAVRDDLFRRIKARWAADPSAAPVRTA